MLDPLFGRDLKRTTRFGAMQRDSNFEKQPSANLMLEEIGHQSKSAESWTCRIVRAIHGERTPPLKEELSHTSHWVGCL